MVPLVSPDHHHLAARPAKQQAAVGGWLSGQSSSMHFSHAWNPPAPPQHPLWSLYLYLLHCNWPPNPDVNLGGPCKVVLGWGANVEKHYSREIIDHNRIIQTPFFHLLPLAGYFFKPAQAKKMLRTGSSCSHHPSPSACFGEVMVDFKNGSGKCKHCFRC